MLTHVNVASEPECGLYKVKQYIKIVIPLLLVHVCEDEGTTETDPNKMKDTNCHKISYLPDCGNAVDGDFARTGSISVHRR